MKRGARFVIIGLAVMASSALVPTAVLAGGSSARPGGGRVGGAHIGGGHFGGPRIGASHFGGGHVAGRFGGPHAGAHHLGGPHRVHPRHFGRHVGAVTVFGAAPLVYYAPPIYAPPFAYGATTYDAPPVYAEPPIAYRPPASGAISLAPSPATSTPNVVQYATGRYELRGDGVTMPYTWVWIPNPPPGPPDASVPEDPTRSRRSKVYRWTDEQGVIHFTDIRDAVPQAYRDD